MCAAKVRRGMLFLQILAAAICICACAGRIEYVFPGEVLELLGETPQQVADGVETARDYFPEGKYGRVYVNETGDLCYLLTDEQRENWLQRGMDSLRSTADYYEEQGRTFEYSEDLKTFSIMIDGEETGSGEWNSDLGEESADSGVDNLGSSAEKADSGAENSYSGETLFSENTEKEIRLYIGEILTLQFFKSGGGELELVTTVLNEDNEVLKQITWQK